MKIFRSLLFLVLLVGCGEIALSDLPDVSQAPAPDTGQPDANKRSNWHSLNMRDKAEHARAVHIALETLGSAPVAWVGQEASGEITVEETSDLKNEIVCRRFHDRLIIDNEPRDVRDIACWVGEWAYVGDAPPLLPVLEPAFAQLNRVYTVKRGGTLRDVANVTGADHEGIRLFNPGLPEDLPPGTQVLLP
ncbi:MAG: hypothetical protein AAF530_14990 [Pseudomonadota bacterium]